MTRLHILYGISSAFLAVVAAITLASTLTLSLPALFRPVLTLGLTILTPFLNDYFQTSAIKAPSSSRRFTLSGALFTLHGLLLTILTTLSGSALLLSTEILNCALHSQWQKLYRNKDGELIQKIQDAFQCCGFRTVKDMAWPFEDPGRCRKMYGREKACLDAWRATGRMWTGSEMGVLCVLVIIQLVVFFFARTRTETASTTSRRQFDHSRREHVTPRLIGSTPEDLLENGIDRDDLAERRGDYGSVTGDQRRLPVQVWADA